MQTESVTSDADADPEVDGTALAVAACRALETSGDDGLIADPFAAVSLQPQTPQADANLADTNTGESSAAEPARGGFVTTELE